MSDFSPFEMGFIGGLVCFVAGTIWYSMNWHTVRSTISAAPVSRAEISKLRRAGYPVSLLVDAHIEVVKSGHDCDIMELRRLYEELNRSKPHSHALRRAYIERHGDATAKGGGG